MMLPASAAVTPEISPGIRSVGGARGICGDGAGSELIDQVGSLSLLRQLEIGGLQLLTQGFHLILRVHVDDSLSVLVVGLNHITESALDQSLGFAAILLPYRLFILYIYRFPR